MLEILSHVNKRIKGHEAIQLPLQDLLKLALDPQSAPLVRNFGLVYAEMACDRAPLQSSLHSVRHLSVLLERTPSLFSVTETMLIMVDRCPCMQPSAAWPGSSHLGAAVRELHVAPLISLGQLAVRICAGDNACQVAATSMVMQAARTCLNPGSTVKTSGPVAGHASVRTPQRPQSRTTDAR